ncbi:MAG: TM2 domain-containing protein [Acidobacteriaceae bacterium]
MASHYLYVFPGTPLQQAAFYQQMALVQKDELIGFLFALLVGGLGLHRFYLGETGWGILYLLFCWTGIPTLVGFIECFFMPGRVRAYNAVRASQVAAWVAQTVPAN